MEKVLPTGNRYLVITTISSQSSPQIEKLSNCLEKFDLKAIVVADKKTPRWSEQENVIFISVE